MSRRGWLLFALMSVIWGIPYLFIKIALEGVSAPFLVLSRTAIGAAILLPIALRRGMVRPALRAWRPLLAFAVLEIGGPWLLLNDAEQHISSSLAGLLIAAVPLVGTLVTWRLGDHSALDPRRLLGLLIGMCGVAAVVGLDVGSASPLRMGEVLLVAVGYAVAPIIADRRLKEVPTLAVISLSLTGVALAYVPAAIVTSPHAWPHANVIGAILTLGLVCTAAAFLLFFRLIAEAGPVRSMVITFINPAVAVLLGMAVLDERFTAGVAVGFPLVLLGSWLSTLKSTPRERADDRVPALEEEVAGSR
ncbi:DMT family transporter [Actinocrinis puniceicyclus]|uniref:DMT family transporter n=1 Tax=Actinocrinis puniceicyclus TaxID=977794 RepID=A0A8J8BFZ0_9ACTN|nr:DMT family transporter [Actinocrinis puniceicyclus]MBS2965199.1 DMT family transporter [Actinocrinis puniceicyclus]